MISEPNENSDELTLPAIVVTDTDQVKQIWEGYGYSTLVRRYNRI